jgi:hypothetical protein
MRGHSAKKDEEKNVLRPDASDFVCLRAIARHLRVRYGYCGRTDQLSYQFGITVHFCLLYIL